MNLSSSTSSKLGQRNTMARKMSPGVNQIIKATFGKAEIDQKANALVCKILNDLFIKVIEQLKESDSKSASVDNVQKAVQKVLPPSLVQYAVSEGQKEVFLSQSMPFQFDFAKLNKKKLALERELRHRESIQMRNRKVLNTCYESGCKKILKEIHPGGDIDNGGSQTMCIFLNSLTKKITDKLNESNAATFTFEDAQKIITAILPAELADHAKAEGNKMMIRFHNRGFEFKPDVLSSEESETASEKAKRENRGKEFAALLSKIVKQSHSKALLHPKGEKIIGRKLSDLTDKIVAKLGDERSLEDVKAAVKAILPPLMAEHAEAEGQKMISRYQRGEFEGTLKGFVPDLKKAESLQLQKAATESLLLTLDNGAQSITGVTHQRAVLGKNGLRRVRTGLSKLIDLIIKNIKDSGVKDVSSEDVQNAMHKVLPGALAEHAVSEAMKMVTLYDAEGFKFAPKNKGKRGRDEKRRRNRDQNRKKNQ